jgi:hypothetical protein
VDQPRELARDVGRNESSFDVIYAVREQDRDVHVAEAGHSFRHDGAVEVRRRNLRAR